MNRSVLLLVSIVASAGLFACSVDDVSKTSIASRSQGLITMVNDAGPMLPDAGPTLPDAGPMLPDAGATLPDVGPTLPDAGSTLPDAGPTPSCSGQSMSVAPKPGVNAVICVTSVGSNDDLIGAYTVTASFQIDGSYFGLPGMIAGSLGLDAGLATDDADNSSLTIVDETSGQWTRNGIPMSASEFAILWSAVAPGQAAPSPGGSMTIDSTVVIQGMALALNNAAAPDPCQADANSLDAAATNYNLAVGGILLGAAAIGLLEVPSLGTATGGFIGLGGLVISAKVSYNAACKNFQLCCKNNNWPAGVCQPKGAKRRGCKNNG